MDVHGARIFLSSWVAGPKAQGKAESKRPPKP
jgi:hypothetical protein